MDAISKEEGFEAVEQYATSNSVIQRSAGSTDTAYYWVAVQDDNNCVDLRSNIYSWWQKVVVIDNREDWVITDGEGMKLMLNCWLEPDETVGDGRIVFEIEGATPFVNGYNIWLNDKWVGRKFTYDSNVSGKPTLVAGDYNFHITDSLGCCWDIEYTINQPDPITFWVDHTDASCEADNGTITIDTTSITGGTGDYDDWWWVYSTSPDFDGAYTDTIKVADGGIKTIATGLAPAVYYVRIFDANGCFADFKNPNGDNAVKVLTTEFDLVYEPIDCWGETTSVSIVITSGTGNHEFEYRARLMNFPWTPYQESNTFTNIRAGLYTFEVHDKTIDCTLSWTEWIHQPRRLWVDVVDLLTLPPTCPENSDGNLVVQAYGGTPFVDEGTGVEYYEYKLDNNDWVRATGYNTFAIDTAEHVIHVRDANDCTDTYRFRWNHMPNEIAFTDTIWNQCPLNKVNLFNADAWDDWYTDWDWAQFGNIVLDWGFLEDFSWYGIPIEHFTGVITFDYWFWTSDSGWFQVPVQGVQQIRNPMFYITDVNPQGNPQAVIDNALANGNPIGHLSSFSAGDYWVVAMDEWGCFSNIEKVVIMDPPTMELAYDTEAAGCDGSTDGKIIVEAENGRYPIPGQMGRYQFMLTQQSHIFTQDEWWTQATWRPFTNGDFQNDSLAVISVQATDTKPYYVAVRDYCAVENPELIQILGPFWIEGSDPVEIAWAEGMIKHITCNIWDPEEETCVSDDDGALTGLLAATTGGSSSNYEYTLQYWGECRQDDTYIEKSATASRWPEINETGEFMNLPAGCYTLTVEDDSLHCMATYDIEIKKPECFSVEVDVINASCFEAHDGIMRYKIFGGTAPFEEATNNVGVWEDANDIPEDRWFDTSSEAIKVHDFWAFDRRVRAGAKEVWVRDAHGCIYGPVEVVVDQPAQLQITDVVAKKVSCNDQNELEEGVTDDGSITFTPLGGWNMDDEFIYYAELWSGATKLQTYTSNTLPATIKFEGLDVGDYTIKFFEWSPTLPYENPITTYQDYFEDWHNWISYAPYQNPDVSKCYVLYDKPVTEPAPIVYDPIVWRDVKCHNEATGEIYVPNITGGTPSITEGYYVGLEGPVDYDYTLQSNLSTHYEGEYGGINWFFTGAGENEFTFDNLTWGHYTVHIMDDNGCWIYKESGEVGNPDTLMIEVVQLVQQAKCNGSTGIIQIDATGGVGEYWYAVDSTLVPDPGSHAFPDDMDLNEYIEGLNWQRSDTFHVTAATWIGYVMDENECIVGFATNENGAPIYHHRVTVLEPDAVEADGFDQVAAKCHGDANGKITIESIWGGNGSPWTIEVSGTDYNGDPIETKTYTKTSSSNIELTGLPASTNLTDPKKMSADDWYTVVVYDKYGCFSEEYKQYVLHPEEFVVVMKDKQNAFICPNDQAGVFEVDVVQGGTPFGTGPDGEPSYEYKWDVYTDAGYTMLVDSLSDDTYGFTKTFLGYAGLYYRVWARDAMGCETSRDTFIVAPDPSSLV